MSGILILSSTLSRRCRMFDGTRVVSLVETCRCYGSAIHTMISIELCEGSSVKTLRLMESEKL
jgi:hypothetical protein